ncbi:MAG: hypothetical protein EP330_28165 [Deltaproteobacteria bacterium]|nr:MAG: hypothetical protein EP330_28165 [Deltaproteobacteria bacterium]
MTPDHLRPAVEALRLGSLLHDPATLLRTLEDEATRRPLDMRIRELLLDVRHQVAAERGVPRVLAEVRRERLVRWDAWSAEWDGVHTRTGEPCRVRALTAASAKDPTLGRQLLREGRALGRLMGLTVSTDDAWPAVAVALPGPSLSDASEPDGREPAARLLGMLGAALDALYRWERSVGLAEVGARDLRLDGDRLSVVCLTPPTGRVRPGQVLQRVAEVLQDWWDREEGPGRELISGMAAFPPNSAEEALGAWRREAAQILAGERHDLTRRQAEVFTHNRAHRLAELLTRLAEAVPPPVGKGAVGVDLEGQTTMVEGRRDGTLWWGTPAAMEPVVGETLDARLGRRLIRARAAAPPNPRLDAQVGGEAGYADVAGRWLTAALQLRTLRLLLDVRD